MKKMTEEQYLPFFVYGTLMTGYGNHNRIVKGTTIYIREASTIGTLYSVGGFPGLIEGENDIEGQLLFIDPKLYDRVLERMDRLEGYYKERPKTSMYIRKKKNIMDNDSGSIIEAWVYYWNGTRSLPIVESGSWREYTNPKIPNDYY
jgi:gamma-glutamylcyclotransferase (GGCT)/AIG2-like uncharacterized protein YtfP